MSLPEWLTLGYLGVLAGAALTRRLPARRIATVLAAIAAWALLVTYLARAPDGQATAFVRRWAPPFYLLLGYWIPALLVTTRNAPFERLLLSLDRAWLNGVPPPFVHRIPGWLRELLEASYLSCYSLMPLGALLLVAAGRVDVLGRYWAVVLLAGFLCYGTLPWTATRPPREIEGEAPNRALLRRINLMVLSRASVRLNTFPSGHAATALGAALALGSVLPWQGLALGAAAAGVVAGSVVGRYHYAADAVAGIAVAVFAYALVGVAR